MYISLRIILLKMSKIFKRHLFIHLKVRLTAISSIPQFHSKAAKARGGPGQNQEPGIPAESPSSVTGS